MRQLKITRDAANTIRAGATLPFIDNSRPVGIDMVLIEIDDEVFRKLEQRRMAGETYSDVIIRINAGTRH
jgi:hypothetical protein